MLKHEDSPQTQSQSAAEVRVTPEELAAAVTALQIRKEGQPGTIAIGEAVDELGLDVTPEEILHAIHRQREERRRRRTRLRGVTAALVTLLVVTVGIRWQPHHQAISSKSSLRATLTIPNQAPLASGQHSIQAMPDGQSFLVDDNTFTLLLQKVPQAQLAVHPSPKLQRDVNKLWQLIKHSGNVYVVAWAPPQSEGQLEKDHISLYSWPPDGFTMKLDNGQDNYVAVTLPVENIHVEDAQMLENAKKITVSNVHPDTHLWEVSY